MSEMSEVVWVDSYEAIYSAGERVSRERGNGNSDAVTMNHVIVELKFLYTFLGYAHVWSQESASSSSSHDNDNDDKEVVKVVADEAEELIAYLQSNFVDRSTNDDPPQKSTSKSVKPWWRWRRSMDPVPSLLDAFNHLNQEIARLKPKIREAACLRSLSTHPFHPHPPSCRTKTDAWDYFCEFVKWNLQYLSKVKSRMGDSLRKQMEALQEGLVSVDWLLHHDPCDCSPWKDAAMAHFGGMFIQVAHACCLCWYALLDPNMEQDMTLFLSDLHHKMDPAPPEFLETTLGFLENGDTEPSLSRFF